MDIDDRELAEAMIGLQFMLGPENDDGTEPHRCTVLRYEPNPVMPEPLQTHSGVTEPLPPRLYRCDTAYCSISPPLDHFGTGDAATEAEVTLSVRFAESMLRGESCIDGANVHYRLGETEDGRDVHFRWMVWTLGTDPYAKRPVLVELDDGTIIEGLHFGVREERHGSGFEVVTDFFHLVQPAGAIAEAWDWVLVRQGPETTFEEVVGEVGFAMGAEPASFRDCQSVVGRGIMTIIAVEP